MCLICQALVAGAATLSPLSPTTPAELARPTEQRIEVATPQAAFPLACPYPGIERVVAGETMRCQKSRNGLIWAKKNKP
jgi:hypothetical protein